jgi:epoxide hydrolase-like predicted phosphatase
MSTVVYDPIHREIPEFFGLTLEDLFRAKGPHAWVDFELGEIDEDECLRRFFDDGREFDHGAFRRTVRAAYRFVDEGMEQLLGDLRKAGYAMHALSNYPSWYHMIEERLQLTRYLEWSFVSCELGVRKPDEAIYRCALERLEVAPEKCIFVDDRGKNCKGAAAVGMQAIRFESSERLRSQLLQAGLAF